MINSSLINGALVNGTGGASTGGGSYNELVMENIVCALTYLDDPIKIAAVSESISIVFQAIYGFISIVDESIVFSDSHTHEQINTIFETITLASSQSNILETNQTISNYLNIIDSVFVKYPITISETLNISSTLIGVIKQLESILETIIQVGSAYNTVSYFNTLSNILLLLDTVSFGIYLSISDVITLNDTLSNLHNGLSAIAESLGIVDSLSSTYINIITLSDTFSITDLITNKAVLKNNLYEGIIVSLPAISGGDTYLAYLLSPETNSVTNYSNYNFIGCTVFGSKYLFYNSTGLYEYGGATDDGDKITAKITTASYNFGSTNLKQVPAMYLGVSNSGQLKLKVRVDGRAEVNYTLRKKSQELQTQKFDIGKGLIGRYFQFELETEADTFNLESIDFYPLELKRKI